MRKLLASLTINIVAGFLLFLAGAVTGHLTRRPVKVIPITFPLQAPRAPAMKASPLPALRRAPDLVRRDPEVLKISLG